MSAGFVDVGSSTDLDILESCMKLCVKQMYKLAKRNQDKMVESLQNVGAVGANAKVQALLNGGKNGAPGGAIAATAYEWYQWYQAIDDRANTADSWYTRSLANDVLKKIRDRGKLFGLFGGT